MTARPSAARFAFGNASKLRLTLLATAVIAIALFAAGPIALPAGYHKFADQRMLLGIPRAGDVLSNLPFLLIGILGLARASPRADAAAASWRWFFICIALTSVGSSVYHWSPSDFGLAIDRLPIAAACAALICAFVAERIDARAVFRSVLTAALLISAATVIYAYHSPLWFGSGGDLRPYLLLQIWPLLMIPLLLFIYPRAHPPALSNAAWILPLLLYLLAKGFEVADHAVLAATGAISGHTIKHLLAAAAALVLALVMPRPTAR